MRDYGVDGQLGLEKTFEEYIDKLCTIYDEVKRVLRDDGTCWVNLGDTYSNSGYSTHKSRNTKLDKPPAGWTNREQGRMATKGISEKSLCLIPQRFAIEMVNRGWILRNVIIWKKPNPMPSSAKDRFTVDFEYVYFFVKSRKYWFEPQYEREYSESTKKRWGHLIESGEIEYGKTRKKVEPKQLEEGRCKYMFSRMDKAYFNPLGRNKRTVWKVTDDIHYVESDGKFYKVSLDCPIHSHYLGAKIQQTGQCDEQQDFQQNHNLDKTNHHGQERVSESASTHSLFSRTNQTKPANGRGQISQNISESKISESSHIAEPENHPHTLDNKEKSVCNSDCSALADESTAISHNSEKSKNASSTSSSYKVLPNKPSGIVHKSNQSLPKCTEAQCTCQEIIVHKDPINPSVWTIPTQSFPEAHFATFPEKLVEPMIRSGCPEFVCTKCGKAREKIYDTESYITRPTTGRDTQKHKQKPEYSGGLARTGGHVAADHYFKGYTDCGCNADWRPGIVWDCFCRLWHDLTGSCKAAA